MALILDSVIPAFSAYSLQPENRFLLANMPVELLLDRDTYDLEL